MGLGYTTTGVYKYIYDEKESNETQIIKYFILCRLGLCIKLNTFLSHMFYEWQFSHSIEIPIDIKQNTYFISFDTYTAVFYLVAGDLNKNKI